MDDGSPALEVGFAIDMGNAFDDLVHLQREMNTTEVKVAAEAAKIERATSGMLDLGRATAGIRTFGSAATKEAQNAARELARVEKAGESLSRQLERQASTFGKTREEIRAMKVETAALAAEQRGLTELAERLRSQQASLASAEAEAAAASERKALADRAAAAAARSAAEMQASLAREALQLRSALDPMFAAQQRFNSALEQAERLYAANVISAREYAAAHDLARTELQRHAQAVAGTSTALEQLAEQERRSAAAAREAAQAEELLAREAAQLRASIDPMFAAQQRFDLEMERAERLFAANAISAREYAAAQQAARTSLYQHAQVVTGAAASLAQLAERERAAAAAAREAAAAQQRLASEAVQLRSAIDPMYAAQQRFDTEMVRADTLLAQGVISQREYAQAVQLARNNLYSHAQAVAGSSAAQQRAIASLGAGRMAMQGLSYQAQDTFTQLSMGANVFSVLAIQGGQAAGAFAFMEGRAGSFARFMLGPRGLAITAGMLVLGALTKGMFDNSDAAKAAEAGMKKFQDRQSDIGNFIDDTTGRLKEQNKTLILNAILARQAQIAANDKEVADSRRKAFDRAGQAALRATQAAPGTTTSGVSFTDDVDVQRVIKAAGNDTGKLAEGLAALAKTRPALAKVALDVSSIGGQAILAQRDNERLNKELRGLAGDTKAFANSSVEAVKREAALAAATTPLEKAKAQLAIVEAEGTAAVKAGGAAVDQYKQKLVGATLAVKAAEEAQKKQTAANRAAASAERREENLQEKLAREAASTEAQTRNLFGLADAYEKSGGAALIAEARVKAESQAIKEQGDIAAFVLRQTNLAIAQRVADAAKSTATLRAQADVQAQVNAAVAAGNVDASEASRLVRDQMADLPLLQAIEAAQQQGLAKEAQRATDALAEQRAERKRLTEEEDRARLASNVQTGKDRLAELREELRLIGATDEARARSLAEFRAQQEVSTLKGVDPAQAAAYVKLQGDIAAQMERNRSAQDAYNDSLMFAADKWDLIARNAQRAGQGMADAFGSAGRAIGDLATIYAGFQADRARLDAQHDAQLKRWHGNEAQIARENQKYAIQTSAMQVGAYGDAAAAAKNFFGEGTAGYEALAAAEKAFRAVEFALSVRAMAQDAIETASSIGNSVARAAQNGVEAVSKALASLPPPLNFVAAAAVVGALAAIGISIAGSFGGSGAKPAPSNTGTGTVLGDSKAQSESLKRAIDELKSVDTLTNVYSRQMLASLKSIDSQISGVASVIVRGGDINASASVAQGFKPNLIGSVLGAIPLVGGILSSLFGTRTDVTGSGIYGGAQSVGSILNGGFNGQAYSDVTKTKKFLGIVTGRSYSTEYGALDPNLNSQFTLILRSFNDAIKAAAVPLGESTDAIQEKLNGFVVNIGKIDLKGLTGEQIQEKLNAVFGAAADNMATAAFPLISQFQKVGEGAFETLTRVASTVEQVSTSLDLLGTSAKGMGIAAKLGLADQFDSVSALNDAATAYFQAFYTSEEQAAAKTAQMGKVFASLGLSVPSTLASFRQLVEAQDLTTAAGQGTYATLLKLAPAFADLQQSLQGAKSAADILSERQDLERQILELQGKTDEIRKLDLAKLDASNRALQLQVWAIQDAQDAAKAADELRQAWTTVGDSIMDEVKRIRGLGDVGGSNTFASLLGQFNAATAAARGGDQDAAKSLPQLSQALLAAAANSATSRQELARVQAQTAASLEATYGAINKLGTAATATSNSALLAAAATAQTATSGSNDNTATIADLRTALAALTDEVKQLRNDNNAGHQATAANTGKTAKVLSTAQDAAGGVGIGTKAVA
ncbi:hypothetical protein [Sphingomonas azotifigens]|uniref:hypothetical protein n=1 Tax=Sphingomonas azotifigens TaxID=330920 RepID=UPI000A052F06|nr:hypothetical protein [Sphingomonas azotifigens]